MWRIHGAAVLSHEAEARLTELTTEHTTLEKILHWCMEQTPPVRFEDMIQQDEFTSDLILPFQDDLFLVYDVT